MHTFRKYISNRGSALFMVISTMTALMITCMAMYFTVLASRSTIYAVFNQKQSYQNSSSIYDMVVNNGLSPTSDLYKQMEKMVVGETLTTPPTEDEYLGTYTVTITKLSENEYDIVVSSTVDGVTETVHNVISITNSEEEVPAGDNAGVSIAPTFAATGYVPNDVYLDKGHFRSDMFFDNEVTYFGAYDMSELFGYGDISCGGSVVMTQEKGMTLCKDDKPITFSIRGDLTVPHLNRDPGFVSGSKILIGGNFYQSFEISNCDIYVNGDVYLMGGNLNNNTTRYFINGDVYLTNGAQTPPNLYCNGSLFDENGNPRQDANNVIKDKWDTVVDGVHMGVADPNANPPKELDGKPVYSYNTIISELDSRTQTNVYYKWTVKDSEISKNGSINHRDIVVNNYNQPAEIVWGSEQWGTGCDVDHIYINGCDGGAGFIIIDTGDNPNNVYTMRLEANRTGPNGEKLFSWTGEKGDNVHIRVLVKGRGSVVFDVPKGVTYQDTTKSIIAHYNWWILCGGQDPHSYTTHNGNSDTQLLGPDEMKKYVHKCVNNDCANFITDDVDAIDADGNQIRCSREVAYEVNGVIQHKICNEVKKTVTCSKHGVTLTYCPKCEMSYVKDLAGNYKICNDHVDVSAVSAKAGESTEYNRDTKGLVMPTTNIYFVSCDESANFSFGQNPEGNDLRDNSTVGYVYAPYLTFYANTGGSGNNAVKFMGGMTVSDYNFLSDQTFIMCVPDKSPTDLMDPDDLKQKFKVSKDWKLELVTH